MFWWKKHEYSDVRVLKKAADIVLGFTNIASQISLGLCSKDVPPSVLSNALVEMSNGLLEIELWQLLVKGPWALGCSVWASRGCSKDVPWLDKSYLTHYWTNQTEFWSSNYNKFFVFGLKSKDYAQETSGEKRYLHINWNAKRTSGNRVMTSSCQGYLGPWVLGLNLGTMRRENLFLTH